MITTLWRKHWMELRGIWAFNALFAILPAIAFVNLAEQHVGPVGPLVQKFVHVFAFFALAMFPVRFAGTGLATSKGFRAPRGADPSLLFTLSLPVRRRTLFFYRTGFCLLAVESLAILGLTMGAIIFAHSGAATRLFADGLWVLLLMVPLYFLDSLLSIRFDGVTITQVQILSAGVLWFVSPHLGLNPQRITAVLSGIAPIDFVLLALLAAAGLAAATVWLLDRHDY
ncbi:MAG: hypothetical protein WA374_08065 [Acidobacteriaceae bacterium]